MSAVKPSEADVGVRQAYRLAGFLEPLDRERDVRNRLIEATGTEVAIAPHMKGAPLQARRTQRTRQRERVLEEATLLGSAVGHRVGDVDEGRRAIHVTVGANRREPSDRGVVLESC